jgi:hypothetical protein
MPVNSLNDLSDDRLPLKTRTMLGLEFAIAILNDAPSFPTHVTSPDTRHPLSSYRVLARLDPLLREAQAAAAKARPENAAHHARAHWGTPTNEDRAAAAEQALIFYGLVKGQSGELASAPESVIADLLTDLMHYAEREDIDFSAALNLATTNLTVESTEKSSHALHMPARKQTPRKC